MQQPIEKMLLKCVVVREDQTIKELLKMLSGNGNNFAAITDASGRAVGVATENDLMKLLRLEPIAGVQAVVTDVVGKELFEQKVSSIMTRDPKRVKKDATTREVLGIMISNSIRYVLVVDDEGKPMGCVRLSEVMKKLVGE